MSDVSELELMELPVLDPGFAADPLPWFRRARGQHPWLARSEVGYLVHEYRAIRDLLRMDDKLEISIDELVETMGARGTQWGMFMEELMINKQGSEHARLRANVAAAFTPGRINQHRQLIRDTVSKLLDEWAPKGEFDFAEFAANFPIRVMCRIIGASPEVVPDIRDALEAQGLSFSMDPNLYPALEGGIKLMFDFVDDLVVERERKGVTGHGDLLDDLLQSKRSGLISDYELRNLLIFLFGAGYDTSKNMLTLIMYEMLERHDDWERCAEDLDYARKVSTETFRYHAVSNVPRTVKEDIHYRDVLLPKGTNVHFILTLAGRDPVAFPDPDAFCPGRKSANNHAAFGMGSHICLGQFLARAQIEEGVHLIAKRLKNPRAVGEVTWRPFVGVWGIKTLPISFTPVS